MTGPRKSEPHYNPGHVTDILLTKQEIADRFGVHPGTVQAWWNKGYLAAHKIKPGHSVRCYSTESDVVEWAKIFYNVGIQPNTGTYKGDSREVVPKDRPCPFCGRDSQPDPGSSTGECVI